jgi:organic radical activating enzyme
MLSRDQYRQFLLSARLTNTIPLGSACGLRCVFCSSKSDIPGARTIIPQITKEEFEECLDFLDLQHRPFVTLAGSEIVMYGEPFLHPLLLEFVEIINQRYPWVDVGVETSGAHCSPRLVKGLNRVRNLAVSVSVNTMDEQARRTYMGVDARRSVRRLLDSGLPIRAVHLTDFGEIDILLRDLDVLQPNGRVEAFVIRRIDYTRFSSPEGRALAHRSMAAYHEHLRLVDDHSDDPRLMAQLLDLDAAVGRFGGMQRTAADGAVARLLDRHGTDLYMCCPDSSYAYLRRKLGDMRLVRVPNLTFGGSVVCAGLLTFRDLRSALLGGSGGGPVAVGSLVGIPANMLNPNTQDLFGETLYHFQQETGYRVVIG